MWSQLEPTLPHVTYLTLSTFLIAYSLFSLLISDRLHLSAPPLAVLFGILLGPACLDILSPHGHGGWGLDDPFTQEFTRVILGVQCFAVGIELPARWFSTGNHAASLLWFLGPVMTYSWAVASLLAYLVFGASPATAAIVGACLSPTDPVLAAAVLGGTSRFSARVPRRVRSLLGAESACNDGASFPFLYAGLYVFETRSAREAVADWLLLTVLYQCALGLGIGFATGWAANHVLRFSEGKGYASRPSLVAFYFLLAVLCVGIGSTLGLDDFLVAFGAGVGFAHDGWFSTRSEEIQGGEASFKGVVDLVLDSSVFVYFGSMIPWASFVPRPGDVLDGHVGPGGLLLFLALVLLLRRLPVLVALHAGRLIPDIKTYKEALFCGHFGPMGVGALFLAIEARAHLETGTSRPLPRPPRPPPGPPYDDKTVATELIWPVVCFVVLGSTVVHGLSGLAISVAASLGRRRVGERAPLLGGEVNGLAGMVHDSESGSEGEGEDQEQTAAGG
jgi:sodium/hydrogen antiporter